MSKLFLAVTTCLALNPNSGVASTWLADPQSPGEIAPIGLNVDLDKARLITVDGSFGAVQVAAQQIIAPSADNLDARVRRIIRALRSTFPNTGPVSPERFLTPTTGTKPAP